ncbi:MAG: DUF3536 domain-containing protein [Planctomycetaceae bacterium]|nr:DUF3536 domain-containing protein [Planctomycetaceae bacterium]
MPTGDRCLLVHGHFYQPPRENPWTGKIDPQPSAAPWENWNRRIADECYIPMARSRLYNAAGEIDDLYNNYAHTSFNFGPTLMSWLREAHPECIRHLADATHIDRTFAMAQVYSHMMLPLADARDRHTQVLWGLREFHARFGFYPEGMWLSECGIDAETVRTLIDHRIRFVILSPHQASKARPFGEMDWREASMGSIDTRRAYRLFDLDGGGRTHFDRFLDVVFYTPGLNLKVSFDHILNRPDDLARELEHCYLPEYDGAQLVSIVTDGEIYGHHEKRGEEALSRLFHDIAPKLGLKVVSAYEFIRDNPPDWEVKLWNGEDKRGSSWSCGHGVGRWYRDCGCRPPTPPGWNQAWREPLRDAFDSLRDRVRFVARRELGHLVWDADDALVDYITIVLDPGLASRRAFLDTHAQRRLDRDEVERLWRVLEAEHMAMLMYTSCGWFFDEISGLEPVQNMRYALRAAELIQPLHDENLLDLLEDRLADAVPNIRRYPDGKAVFRQLAVPGRHDNRELAAAMAVCLTANFPLDCLSWKLVDKTETVNYADSTGNHVSWGSFVCHDERLDRFIRASWLVRLDDGDNTAIGLHGYEEVQGDPYREQGDIPFKADEDFTWLQEIPNAFKDLNREEVMEKLGDILVRFDRFPEAVRAMIYRTSAQEAENTLLAETVKMGMRSVPFLDRANKHGARAPEYLTRTVVGSFELRMIGAVYEAAAAMEFGDDAAEAVEKPRGAAVDLGLNPSLDAPYRAVYAIGLELLRWYGGVGEAGWLDGLRTRDLNDGRAWLAPTAAANHALRYPAAGGFAQALGIGLAKLRQRLLAGNGVAAAALTQIPFTELLSYAQRLRLEPRGMVALGIAYWDFLGAPLRRLIRRDPTGIMDGEAGVRIRVAGTLLGFSDDAVARRIDEAIKG